MKEHQVLVYFWDSPSSWCNCDHGCKKCNIAWLTAHPDNKHFPVDFKETCSTYGLPTRVEPSSQEQKC